MLTRDITIDLGERERKAAAAARRFPVSVSSEKPVQRRDWQSGQVFDEVLSHARGAVDLSRAPLPVLEGHDRSKVNVGVVTNLKLDGARLRGELVLGASQRAQELAADIAEGIVTGLSVGYTVDKQERDEKAKRLTATKWTPYEVSIVSVPADVSVGINRSHAMEDQDGTTTNPAPGAAGNPETLAERERAVGVRQLVRRVKLGDELADDLVARGVTLDAAHQLVLDRLAADSDAHPIAAHTRFSPGDGGGAPQGGDTNRRIALMAEALAARFGGPKPSDEARQFSHMRVRDMAKDLLEVRGVSTRFLSDAKIITRAGYHTTGDFPILLQETGGRLLRDGYRSYQGGVRRICRESSAPDFRAKARIQLGEAPGLEKVTEAGEFKRGTMKEAKETYSLATFGKVFGITRQALINDDLGAFADLTVRLGRSAAEFVSGQIVDLLTAASGVGPTLGDGVVLFHAATHKNLGTPAVISIASLTEALKLMRLAKGLDGVTPIDVTPKYLVVPAALEVVAKQFVTQITPSTSAAVNPFSGTLEVVVDPRLDAKSATAWYLAADPSAFDTIEFSYLEGEPGPTFETRAGFDVDGIETRVRLDFGCGVLDYRGLYRNAGA